MESTQIRASEINVGVLADAARSAAAADTLHVAVEFLLTGRWMDAAEAKHWGLANHVVPRARALRKPAKLPPAGDGAAVFPASNNCYAIRNGSEHEPSNSTTRWTWCSG